MKDVSPRYLLIFSIFLFFLLSGCSKEDKQREHFDGLTDEDIQLIDNYVKTIPVKDGIGQLLMVGVPADLNTAVDSDSKVLDYLIGELGVGLIIVNGYNYYDNNMPDDNEYLNRVIQFNNLLQGKTKKSQNKLPLLIAADFEGPSYPTVKRGLVLPPSALSLGTTQNAELIHAIGQYVGTELSGIGIQIILGPVLDTYTIKQGSKNILQDRCFAASPEGVASTASHYISGLHESGIIVFAKHFPSYGSIDTPTSEQVIPTSQGSIVQLREELKPFIQSKDGIHGIMTSHIRLGNTKGSGMATFSSEAIGEFLNDSVGLQNKIIITDDLSDMGAIKRYMTDNRKSYSDIAIDAFDSGHNVLMFSHVSNKNKKIKYSKTYRGSNFNLDDLVAVQEKLTDHINSSEPANKHFRESLRKILILKAQAARIKSPEEPLQHLFSKNGSPYSVYNFNVNTDGQVVTKSAEKSILQHNLPIQKDAIPEGELGDALVKEAIRKSSVTITNKNDINLSKLPEDAKIVFAVYEDFIPKFENAFSPHFKNIEYFRIPAIKDTKQFSLLEKKLFSNFRDADVIIYTARDSSDADLLKRLYNKFGKSYTSKVLVFCHNSPSIFDNDMLSNTNMIGNFSMHPFSFDIDVEILKGDTVPQPLQNMPINIGDNGQFYSINATKWVAPADYKNFNALFRAQPNQVSMDDIKEKNILIPKKYVSIFGHLMMIMICIFVPYLTYKVPNFYISQPGAKPNFTLLTLGHPIMGRVISLLLFSILVCLLFYKAQFMEFTGNVVDFTDAAKNITNNIP